MACRRLRFEIAFVAIVSLVVLVPGIWSYTLVDPWETHYGEVSRRLLADHDWVHTRWEDEGFRSKPILMFWFEAASMRALGLAADGGYSGELIDAGPRTMLAIRLPFVLSAVAGLVAMWWMLARLVSRRVAWLALLVVGTCPMFFLIARQAIPDMLLASSMIGAVSVLLVALEDGERAIEPVWRGCAWTAIVIAIGGQAAYYAYLFTTQPRLADGLRFPGVNVVLPLVMVAGLAALRWPAPVRTARQVCMLWFYVLLGLSVLAKGPVAVAVIGASLVLYLTFLKRWRDVLDGKLEIKRGIVIVLWVCVPWHFAMYLKEGPGFVAEYIGTHLLNRAGDGSFEKSYGTFAYYTLELGYGMWMWAALLPQAFARLVLQRATATKADRAKLFIGILAIVTVAFFDLIQTKFHHYILPAIPALGIIVACYVDDRLSGRVSQPWPLTAISVAIALLICRDLVHSPQRWIEMFVYRYDRPWPAGEPWSIDPSRGFVGLGALVALALLVVGTRWSRAAVLATVCAALSVCLWGLHGYMPVAATHWGMRDAVQAYYDRRTIYGEKLIYFGDREVRDAWASVGDTWSFETYVPRDLQVGQPMTLTVEVYAVASERTLESQQVLLADVVAIGAHRVTVELRRGEGAKLAPLIAAGEHGPRGRAPIAAVDADRLIAWQLYWRGEAFWSGDEIWGWLPEMKTSGPIDIKPDNVAFLKYINDRMLNALGRRCFIVTEAGRALSVRSLLPTQRSRDSLHVVDETSNKFSLVEFYL